MSILQTIVTFPVASITAALFLFWFVGMCIAAAQPWKLFKRMFGPRR